MSATTETEQQQQPKPVPIGAVMSKLGVNTHQRDIAQNQLHYAQIKIRESKEGHIATLGRLLKYEGLPIIEEALEYAKTAGLFVECESKFVGVTTTIKEYKTKSGKKFLAHFTIYDSYISKVTDGDDKPKSYKGYFLYKNYAEQLEKYRNNNITTFTKINDLFDFTK
jgi:hypothetical protein